MVLTVEVHMSLTTKDKEDAKTRAKQLSGALMMSGPSNAALLIEAYIQEAILYGKTGNWLLDTQAPETDKPEWPSV